MIVTQYENDYVVEIRDRLFYEVQKSLQRQH